jgi:hypothetical protein
MYSCLSSSIGKPLSKDAEMTAGSLASASMVTTPAPPPQTSLGIESDESVPPPVSRS